MRLLRLLPIFVGLMLAGASSAWAALSVYQFTEGTGTQNSMSGATTVYTSGTDDASTGTFNIGFTFNFDGTSYTAFSVSSNGLLGLGSSVVSSSLSNNISSNLGTYPYIAAFWDDLVISGGLSYVTTGVTGSRVLTVQWDARAFSPSSNTLLCQVRLYEGSNKIEWWYGTSTTSGWSASIGAAGSSSNYFSINPTSPAAYSFSSSYNSVSPPASGTLYSISPCQLNITIAGNVAQSGTAAMNNGDSIFVGQQVQRGNNRTYQPFTISMGSTPCSPVSYSYTFSGANAGDYSITPASGPIGGSGTNTPTITFTPSGIGVRSATLTVADNQGFSRTYKLFGQGTTRIRYSGNVAQGGTTNVNSGDTLLVTKIVTRKTSQSFTPLSLLNFNTNSAAPAANVTFTITDPSGQYSVSPATATIGANQTISPIITFAATGVGFQEAYLTVSADGEPARTYLLRAFSAAPGGDFVVGGQKLSPSSALYVNQQSCVGASVNTLTVTLSNTGFGDFVISRADFYTTDTAYTQGSSHPLLRDANGRPIPASDYFLSAAPGSSVPVNYPIVLPQGQSTTLYLSYIGTRPGKRYARAFIRTNGQNFLGTDTNAAPSASVEGLLNFDLFAQGIGAVLSDNPKGGLPKSVVFAPVAVGDSADMTFTLVNAGQCDLRISRKNLQITSGDVNEFRLVSAFNGLTLDPATDDYILQSGATSTVTVRFAPVQFGSRRASLWLKTNDSTVYLAGVAERGSYYLDLFGSAKPNLLSKNVDLGMAAIGVDTTRSMAVFQNPSRSVVTVNSIAISGTDAVDFSASSTLPWPTTPFSILPGATLNLGVQFAPLTGVPGPRTATLTVTLSSGETFTASLNAIAGTRTLVVNPTAVVFPPIASGKQSRQLITITNTGTMPITLSSAPTLGGANPTNFTLSAFPRLVLAPNQIEFLEATFVPRAAGASNATITITSNANGGAQTVTLTAQASKTRLVLDPADGIHVNFVGNSNTQPIARVITVRNEGDEAVRLTDITFSGPDAAQFRIQQGPTEILANTEQTLTLEVLPNGHDLSAQLQVAAINEVTGEEVQRTAPVDAAQQKTSGVSQEAVAGSGLRLDQSMPNPAKGEAVIGYRLNAGGEITLSLYDVNGVQVRQLETGYREMGEHQIHVDLSGVPSGQYVYRLTANGTSLARSLTVVK